VEKSWSKFAEVGYAVRGSKGSMPQGAQAMSDGQISDDQVEAAPSEEPEDKKRRSAWPMWVALALILLLVLWLLWDYLQRQGGEPVTGTTTSSIRMPSASPPPSEPSDSGEPSDEIGPTVPDVVGLMTSSAERKLAARGYEAHVTVLHTNDQPRGVVFEQVPAAGSFAEPGSTVSILVSGGPRPAASVELPDFVGMKREAAVRKIETLGLEPKVMVSANDKGRRRVYQQSPAAGTKVVAGSKVFLLVTVPY
jgi:hypothetical protein